MEIKYWNEKKNPIKWCVLIDCYWERGYGWNIDTETTEITESAQWGYYQCVCVFFFINLKVVSVDVYGAFWIVKMDEKFRIYKHC